MGIVKKNSSSVVSNQSDNVLRQNWNIGDGLKFNGTSHYSNMGNILGFEYTDPLTVSTIFSVQDFTPLQIGTNRWIFWKGINGLPAYGYFIDHTVVSFVFSVNPSTYLIFRHLFSPTINTIYHITFTKSAAQVGYFYINGIRYTSEVVTLGTMSSVLNTRGFLLCEAEDGAGLMQAYFKATLHDLKIFDKELTNDEAIALWSTQNKIVSSTCISNLKLDLRFEDKQGVIIKDHSINIYNATTTHTVGETTLGVSNSWVDKYGNSITQL